ncbi:alpha/beta hydrolase-fold protein [Gangjinia marincola]|uniref:Alpha/beta hydrolase-fold protein n=1 Tax=Gangjinia marincola TaxID=578463 RepID=A0ABN1MGR8_9FLAO
MKNIILFLLIVCFSGNAQQPSPVKVKNAVLAGGTLESVDSFPSNYIQSRRVDIWLPQGYTPSKKYGVLYMHDGQNLFDSTTTWNKQEWKIDETVTKLVNADKIEPVIVVGIHSISDIRWQDLYPEKTFDYMPKETAEAIRADAQKQNFNTNLTGDEYLKFLVEELKPFVDKTYATKPDKENTFVAGSSMGGLMSMYAIHEYPEILGGAAGISTHWPGANPTPDNPFEKAIFKYVEATMPNPKTHHVYYDFGTKTLDQYYPKYAPTVDSLYHNAGYTAKNFKNLKFEGTDHSEASWQKRVDVWMEFLMEK